MPAATRCPTNCAWPTADSYIFYYEPPDGEREVIGNLFPHLPGQTLNAVARVVLAITEDGETAELWRAELVAGQAPRVQRMTCPPAAR